MLPPLSLTASSSSAARGESTAGFDNSGFVVNFGAGNSVGAAAGMPSWLMLALVGGAALWLMRHAKA